MKTERTLTENSPQKVLKSMPPVEEISINISKDVNGTELEKVLNGVAAFTKAFPEDESYKLNIKLVKHPADEKVIDNDK